MLDRTLLPNAISLDKFTHLLSRYGPLIEKISTAKGTKPGQKTLLELDHFRYNDAVSLFHSEEPKQQMKLGDVKVLVDWKLRHGKFRPTLMKLVTSNEEASAEQTIQEAMKVYWADHNTSKALDMITKLKGIGPATASLLLSVHDPNRVIFFSDEAFYWLCRDGQKSPIKYNAKEYAELSTAAQALVGRLGVDATHIEKVAYVLMKDEPSEDASTKEETKEEKNKSPINQKPVKRKGADATEVIHDNTSQQAPLRRSKRGKAS